MTREMVEFVCQKCGKHFFRKGHVGDIHKYCSKACKDEARRCKKTIQKKCLHCGKVFLAIGKISIEKRKFCSKICSVRYRVEHIENKKGQKGTYICKNCGKQFQTTTYAGRIPQFCSRACGCQKRMLGVPKSENQRRKIAEAQKYLIKKGDFVCDRCGRHFESNTSCRAHRAHCQHDGNYVCDSCQSRFKTLRALRTHQHYCFATEEEKSKLSKFYSERTIKLIHEGKLKNCPSTNTKLEQVFREKLFENKIVFEEQFLIEGINHNYDFFLPEYNLIIETDGDWFHGNPDKIKELRTWQKRQYHVDCCYTEQAREHGYLIVRFWENDIKHFCEECVEEALNYGKSNGNYPVGRRRSI